MSCKHNRIIKRVHIDNSGSNNIHENYIEKYECAHCGILFKVIPQN